MKRGSCFGYRLSATGDMPSGRVRWVWLALLMAFLPVGIALAHPQIISTQPPADAQLSESPAVARVTFNEDIEESFAQIQVFNTQEQQVDLGNGGRILESPTTLSVDLPSLPAGIYTVLWQAVGSDGHLVKGYFAFTITGLAATTPKPLTPTTQLAPTAAPQSSPPAPTTLTQEPTPPIALPAILRSLVLLGALVACGAWFFSTWVVQPIDAIQSHDQAALTRLNRGLIGVSLVLLLLTIPAFLALQTDTIASTINISSVWLTLSHTRLGQALGARLLIVAGLFVLMLPRTQARWHLPLVATLYSGMLLTFSASGHAGAQTSALLPIFIDWLHLVATSCWVGGLVAFALGLPILRRATTAQAPSILAQVTARFSSMALICIIILAASGTYAALHYLSAISDLWTSTYGQVLSAKLLLFAILLGFGAYHLQAWRRKAHQAPRNKRQEEDSAAMPAEIRIGNEPIPHFMLSLRAETLIAVVVIGLVGLLTSIALPDAQPQTPQPSAQRPTIPVVQATPRPTRTPAPIKIFEEEQASADLRVRLRVEPAALGKNDLLVTVLDAQGKQLNVQRVQATIAMDVMDMGETKAIAEPNKSGIYVMREQWLSMVGVWQVAVVVRRSDADDVTVVFQVPVGG